MQTRTGKPTPGRAARGFTLVELIVALVLVAIFAALTVPALSGTMARNDARKTARVVANAFRTARNQATSRGEVVFAKVDPGTGRGEVTLRRSDTNETSCGLATADDSNTVLLDATPNPPETDDPWNVAVADLSSRMAIHSVNTDNSPQWICFSPGGQVFDGSGDIFYDSECEGENFRIFLAEDGVDVNSAGGGTDLTVCEDDQSDRQDLQDDRSVYYYWEVRVPYNGAIEASN